MAMMDNVDFLIGHIRNAFITSDDTSMSEWIITECRYYEDCDSRNKSANRDNNTSRGESNGDCLSDSELKGSMDIHPDMDFGAHRRRSNTAQRLEKLKKDKRNQGKVKTIIWKDAHGSFNVENRGHLFDWKELPPVTAFLPNPQTDKQVSYFSQDTDSMAPHQISSPSSTTTNSIPSAQKDLSHNSQNATSSHQNSTLTQESSSLPETNSTCSQTQHDVSKENQSSPEKPDKASVQGDMPDIVIPLSPTIAIKRASKISSLSKQIQALDAQGSNPFFKYAKFDGRTAGGAATKKLDVFLPFAPAEQRSYPMTVLVTANAKGQEVMGLVCWQYVQEGRKPGLETVVGPLDPNDDIKFSLHMAEDDGEIDTDFPPIVPTDPVSRYGFTKFALVPNPPEKPKAVFVTIHVPNQGFNMLQVETKSVTMRELMEKIIKKRKIRIRPGLNYTLEKKHEVGKPVDLDSTFGNMNCNDFYLIRENSSRGNVENTDENEDQRIAESLMSHQYKSFIVSMVHRLRTNTEVQLGISGEKIEIDPVLVKGAARLFRQKPFTYDADHIANCDIQENKGNGRSVFRLTSLSGHDYKHHQFEADAAVAEEIVEKVNTILEVRCSSVRKDFVFTQEKKALQKRDSIKYQRDS